MTSYIENNRKLFLYYKTLGEKTFSQISEDNLFVEFAPGINSIAIIIQHLHGNMLSRWTHFLDSDGEKSWRKRDEEFEPILKDAKTLFLKWEEGWDCTFNALNQLTDADVEKKVFIRNQGILIHDAIQRQMAHYAYHIGQISILEK